MKLFLLLILAVGGKHISLLSCTAHERRLFRVFFLIHGGSKTSKGEHALNMAKVGLLCIVLKHDNGGLNVRQNL